MQRLSEHPEYSVKDRGDIAMNRPTDDDIRERFQRCVEAYQQFAEQMSCLADQMDFLGDLSLYFDSGVTPDEYGRIRAQRKLRDPRSHREVQYKAPQQIRRNLPYQRQIY